MTTVHVFDVALDWLVEQDVDRRLDDEARKPLLDDLDRWRDLLIALREKRVDEKNRLLERNTKWEPTSYRKDEVAFFQARHEHELKQAGARIMAVQNRISEVNRLRARNGSPTVHQALRDAVVRAAVRWRRGEDDGRELLAAVDGLITFDERRAS